MSKCHCWKSQVAAHMSIPSLIGTLLVPGRQVMLKWCLVPAGVFVRCKRALVLSYSTYGKCSKILNTFLCLFSNKMLTVKAYIHKMLVRKTNREDPDQTASSEAV